jgi:hypothetical protein
MRVQVEALKDHADARADVDDALPVGVHFPALHDESRDPRNVMVP